MEYSELLHLAARQIPAADEDKSGGEKLLDLLKDPFKGQV
jgi:hypothetical protein